MLSSCTADNTSCDRGHTSIISAKRRKGKSLETGSKRKFPPWICLPSLLDVFSKDDLHHRYPHLFEVATLPVTVASCERTHSKVKIINNDLRVAMSPDRLEDLVQIGNERDLANNIELSKLVEIFKLAKPQVSHVNRSTIT
jgi:hypothetical protein